MRRAGLGLIGAGVGLDLAGAGMLVAGFSLNGCAFAVGAETGSCGPTSDIRNGRAADALFWSGLAVSVAGDLVHIAGIATWSVGAARLKRLQREPAAR